MATFGKKTKPQNTDAKVTSAALSTWRVESPPASKAGSLSRLRALPTFGASPVSFYTAVGPCAKPRALRCFVASAKPLFSYLRSLYTLFFFASMNRGKRITTAFASENAGDIPVIAGGEQNNGILRYLDEACKTTRILKDSCISVAAYGTAGCIHYHGYKCFIDDKALEF